MGGSQSHVVQDVSCPYVYLCQKRPPVVTVAVKSATTVAKHPGGLGGGAALGEGVPSCQWRRQLWVIRGAHVSLPVTRGETHSSDT